MEEYEIECTECGWSGLRAELWCSDVDAFDTRKPVNECKFNICPECEKSDCFEDLEQD